jgi:hypothetical protein
VTDSGTSFSDLHAVVQAWQPIQLSWSMTFAQRAVGLLLSAGRGSAMNTPSSMFRLTY